MDQIDKQIEEYIEDLVKSCLNSPAFASVSDDQKAQVAEKLRNHFYSIILEVVVEAMDEEQFSQVEYLDPSSPEMAEKIQTITSQIPNIHQDIEQKLSQEVEKIKQNPSAFVF